MQNTVVFISLFSVALGIGIFIGKLIFSSKVQAEKLVLEEKINNP